MDTQEQNLIQAVLAVVTGSDPPTCDNWEELIRLAKFHGVQGLLAELLRNANEVPKSLSDRLLEEQTLLIIKDANQESEVRSLMKLFEQKKTPIVMLKGWYLKSFYPRSDLRSMADTDIFIRQSDENTIHNILKEQGYNTVTFGGKKDNVYNKEPFITLEMHKNLFMFEDEWNEFFNNENSQMYIWRRVEKVEDFEYIYRMDDELFFTYMIAHIAKHLLDDGGIGIKAFLDVWLFIEKSPQLDLDAALHDLDKLGLTDFTQNVIDLSQFWFGNKNQVKETVEEFGDYILKCGVFGNSKFFVATKEELMSSEKPSQLKYVFRRAFPTIEAMKTRFPQLNNRIWLLPFLYIKRLFYSLINRTEAVKGELTGASKVDYDEAKQIHRLYKNIGLR